MSPLRIAACAAFLCFRTGLAAEPAAFPGAEGFGADTPGGRGGKILLVTNLDDSGAGSFRAACDAAGPRIILFRVGGLIDLKSPIHIREPYVTIAGQSSPGDGICIRGREFKVDTHDAIVRFLRCRLGDLAGKEDDAMGIGGQARNVIFDHCSASWSVDEVLSPSGGISDITVEWCIIAEGLNHSVHAKGAHGYGSLVRASGGLTMHHNLWASNDARNPRLGDNYGRPPFPTFDFRNNVIYNYGGICSGMTGDQLSANYVANYIRPGADSNHQRAPIVLTKTADVKYYITGNVVEGHPEWTSDNRTMFTPAAGDDGRRLFTIVDRPFEAPPVRTTSAREAFEIVLRGAGATAPVRDSVDERIVSGARSGKTGRIIDSQKQVGGWPGYRGGEPPLDTDGDGIPDAWEQAHGLDPRDPSDASKRNRSGYTMIEVYLNDLASNGKSK